jgi:hypothetical protein
MTRLAVTCKRLGWEKADSLIMSLILSPDVKQVSEEFAIFLEAGRGSGGGGGEDSFVTVSSLGEANIARPNRGQIEFRSINCNVIFWEDIVMKDGMQYTTQQRWIRWIE